MNNFYIDETDLASRRSAAALRAEIEAHLLNGCATVDLSGVESVSESYADELFGVLVAHYSLPWVFSRLQVVGARPAVIKTITQALRYRLEQGAPVSAEAKPHALRKVVAEAVERHHLAFAS